MKPTYGTALFESEGPVDEDVLRQFEKDVKDYKVEIGRLMILESKESYDKKLKDTIFAVNELKPEFEDPSLYHMRFFQIT